MPLLLRRPSSFLGSSVVVVVVVVLFFFSLSFFATAAVLGDDHDDHDGDDDDAVVEAWLKGMSVEDKIGQMSQIDVSVLLLSDRSGFNASKVDYWIGQMGIGSVLNTPNTDQDEEGESPDGYWDASQYLEASKTLKDAARRHNKPMPTWGLDSVHGANYVRGATVFPHPINQAMTFNVTAPRLVGKAAARDTFASLGPGAWVFSPLVGLAVEPRWSRVYETYGEDPHVVGEFAAASIGGIQSGNGGNGGSTKEDDPSIVVKVAACAKHFVGYSAPRDGHDRSPSWIPTRHLYQYFVPPWKKALGSDGNGSGGAMTVMESYTETDGVPNVANRGALNGLLRRQLEFDGVVVTDYEEMRNLAAQRWHGVADSTVDAVKYSLREGSVDVSMIPLDPDELRESILDGLRRHEISKDRVDDSVRRVLRLKRKLGILDAPNDGDGAADEESDKEKGDRERRERELIQKIGTDGNESLEIARQGMVLAKNVGGALPTRGVADDDYSSDQTAMAKTSSTTSSSHADDAATIAAHPRAKVLVTGPTSTSLTYQCGGWTGLWQGLPPGGESAFFSNSSESSTVLEAFSRLPFFDVSYACGVDITGNDCAADDEDIPSTILDQVKSYVGLGNDKDSIGRAVAAAASSGMEYVVVCIGEESYTEKPGDIRSLDLPDGQYELVRALAAVKKAKSGERAQPQIIVVYFGGRPRLLRDITDDGIADAVLLAMLPGPRGGEAVADLLTGKVNPSAKLPITWPKYQDGGGIPYYHAVSDQCTDSEGGNPAPHYGYVPCDVEFPFGHGLSYTTFEYTRLEARGGVDEDLVFSVKVQNTGRVPGADAVMVFTFDEFRTVTPEYKRLRFFEKLWLAPGQQKTVKGTIPLDELKFVGPHDDTHYIIDPNMVTYVGVGPSVDCRHNDDDKSKKCVRLESSSKKGNSNKPYVAACDAACDVWSSSGCSGKVFAGRDTRASCVDMCSSISRYPATGMDGNNDGWGWDYVNCIENVVWGSRGAKNDPDLCWKMTSMCRDILATGTLDEYGLGAGGAGGSSSSRLPTAEFPAGNIVALVVALIATGIIMFWMNGGELKRRSEDDEVQFTRVSNAEEV